MIGNGSPLHDIDHIVVLMFENRSFDNILGRIYTGHVAKNKGFEPLPLDAVNYSKPGDQNSTAYQVWTTDNSFLDRETMTIPTPDPGELFSEMNLQVFGEMFGKQPKYVPKNPGPPPVPPNMSGFASSYAVWKCMGGPGGNPKDIMHYFSTEQLPVSHFLARKYAISDHWHGSSPTQTFPNRLFAHCATSGGMINNTQVLDVLLKEEILGLPSIFDELDALSPSESRIPAGTRKWKVYYHDFPVSALVKHVRDNWKFGDANSAVSHFSDLDIPWTTTGTSFFDDVENDNLPAYSFIEPRYGLLQNIGRSPIIPPNDNHPPFNLAFGELLLFDVWDALKKSNSWNNTLLIITYDEHGGCYDHHPPTSIAVSPSGDSDDHPFVRYGPRVPAMLMSPRIQSGGILKPSPDPDSGITYPFDHTSIIKTVRECFAVGDASTKFLTQRDRVAPSLAPAINGSSRLNEVPEGALDKPAIEVTSEDIDWLKKVGPSDLVVLIKEMIRKLGITIPE